MSRKTNTASTNTHEMLWGMDMFEWIQQMIGHRRARQRRGRVASYVEMYENRVLLSAMSSVAADVVVQSSNTEGVQRTLHFASLSSFNGDWQISAGSVLHLVQSGKQVSGTKTLIGTNVATFSGEVHGHKLSGQLNSIGVDAHSVIKVKLVGMTEFTGTRHYYVNGASAGTKAIKGVKL